MAKLCFAGFPKMKEIYYNTSAGEYDSARTGKVRVHSQVYEPAADTYLLMETALKEVSSTDTVIEIGTGCGIIARELAKTAETVVAADINPYAVRCARANGVANVVRADLFSGIRGRYSLIVFNPPYIPIQESEKHDEWIECAWDGGPSGADVINRFLEQAKEHMTVNGRILLLISTITGVERVMERIGGLGMKAEEIASSRVPYERLTVLRSKAP